jgi:phosphoribosylformylglycinamidine (FGAM) synthase PurS component
MLEVKVYVPECLGDPSGNQAEAAYSMELTYQEINTVGELESAFRRIAHMLGFHYIGDVRCIKLASMKLEDEENAT